MSEHTPGPWHVYEDDEEPTLTVSNEVMPSYYNPIWGAIFAKRPITDTDRANACLIAAAPDLLEVVKGARMGFSALCDHEKHLSESGRNAIMTTIGVLSHAIAKAEGQED